MNDAVKEGVEGGAQQAQQTVLIYADGACRGNPGPGGWEIGRASCRERV